MATDVDLTCEGTAQRLPRASPRSGMPAVLSPRCSRGRPESCVSIGSSGPTRSEKASSLGGGGGVFSRVLSLFRIPSFPTANEKLTFPGDSSSLDSRSESSEGENTFVERRSRRFEGLFDSAQGRTNDGDLFSAGRTGGAGGSVTVRWSRPHRLQLEEEEGEDRGSLEGCGGSSEVGDISSSLRSLSSRNSMHGEALPRSDSPNEDDDQILSCAIRGEEDGGAQGVRGEREGRQDVRSGARRRRDLLSSSRLSRLLSPSAFLHRLRGSLVERPKGDDDEQVVVETSSSTWSGTSVSTPQNHFTASCSTGTARLHQHSSPVLSHSTICGSTASRRPASETASSSTSLSSCCNRESLSPSRGISETGVVSSPSTSPLSPESSREGIQSIATFEFSLRGSDEAGEGQRRTHWRGGSDECSSTRPAVHQQQTDNEQDSPGGERRGRVTARSSDLGSRFIRRDAREGRDGSRQVASGASSYTASSSSIFSRRSCSSGGGGRLEAVSHQEDGAGVGDVVILSSRLNSEDQHSSPFFSRRQLSRRHEAGQLVGSPGLSSVYPSVTSPEEFFPPSCPEREQEDGEPTVPQHFTTTATTVTAPPLVSPSMDGGVLPVENAFQPGDPRRCCGERGATCPLSRARVRSPHTIVRNDEVCRFSHRGSMTRSLDPPAQVSSVLEGLVTVEEHSEGTEMTAGRGSEIVDCSLSRNLSSLSSAQHREGGTNSTRAISSLTPPASSSGGQGNGSRTSSPVPSGESTHGRSTPSHTSRLCYTSRLYTPPQASISGSPGVLCTNEPLVEDGRSSTPFLGSASALPRTLHTRLGGELSTQAEPAATPRPPASSRVSATRDTSEANRSCVVTQEEGERGRTDDCSSSRSQSRARPRDEEDEREPRRGRRNLESTSSVRIHGNSSRSSTCGLRVAGTPQTEEESSSSSSVEHGTRLRRSDSYSGGNSMCGTLNLQRVGVDESEDVGTRPNAPACGHRHRQGAESLQLARERRSSSENSLLSSSVLGCEARPRYAGMLASEVGSPFSSSTDHERGSLGQQGDSPLGDVDDDEGDDVGESAEPGVGRVPDSSLRTRRRRSISLFLMREEDLGDASVRENDNSRPSSAAGESQREEQQQQQQSERRRASGPHSESRGETLLFDSFILTEEELHGSGLSPEEVPAREGARAEAAVGGSGEGGRGLPSRFRLERGEGRGEIIISVSRHDGRESRHRSEGASSETGERIEVRIPADILLPSDLATPERESGGSSVGGGIRTDASPPSLSTPLPHPLLSSRTRPMSALPSSRVFPEENENPSYQSSVSSAVVVLESVDSGLVSSLPVTEGNGSPRLSSSSSTGAGGASSTSRVLSLLSPVTDVSAGESGVSSTLQTNGGRSRQASPGRALLSSAGQTFVSPLFSSSRPAPGTSTTTDVACFSSVSSSPPSHQHRHPTSQQVTLSVVSRVFQPSSSPSSSHRHGVEEFRCRGAPAPSLPFSSSVSPPVNSLFRHDRVSEDCVPASSSFSLSSAGSAGVLLSPVPRARADDSAETSRVSRSEDSFEVPAEGSIASHQRRETLASSSVLPRSPVQQEQNVFSEGDPSFFVEPPRQSPPTTAAEAFFAESSHHHLPSPADTTTASTMVRHSPFPGSNTVPSSEPGQRQPQRTQSGPSPGQQSTRSTGIFDVGRGEGSRRASARDGSFSFDSRATGTTGRRGGRQGGGDGLSTRQEGRGEDSLLNSEVERALFENDERLVVGGLLEVEQLHLAAAAAATALVLGGEGEGSVRSAQVQEEAGEREDEQEGDDRTGMRAKIVSGRMALVWARRRERYRQECKKRMTLRSMRDLGRGGFTCPVCLETFTSSKCKDEKSVSTPGCDEVDGKKDGKGGGVFLKDRGGADDLSPSLLPFPLSRSSPAPVVARGGRRGEEIPMTSSTGAFLSRTEDDDTSNGDVCAEAGLSTRRQQSAASFPVLPECPVGDIEEAVSSVGEGDNSYLEEVEDFLHEVEEGEAELIPTEVPSRLRERGGSGDHGDTNTSSFFERLPPSVTLEQRVIPGRRSREDDVLSTPSSSLSVFVGEADSSITAVRQANVRRVGESQHLLRSRGKGGRRRRSRSSQRDGEGEGQDEDEDRDADVVLMTGRCTHAVCCACATEWLKHQLVGRAVPVACPVCRGGHFDDAVVRFLSSSLGEWLAYLELKRAQQGLVASPLSQQLLRETRGGEARQEEGSSSSVSTSTSRDLLLLLLPREHLQIQQQRQQEMLEDDVLIHGFRRCPGCGIAIQRVGSLDDVLCRCGCRFCFACGESLSSSSFWTLLQHRRSCRSNNNNNSHSTSNSGPAGGGQASSQGVGTSPLPSVPTSPSSAAQSSALDARSSNSGILSSTSTGSSSTSNRNTFSGVLRLSGQNSAASSNNTNGGGGTSGGLASLFRGSREGGGGLLFGRLL